MTNRGLVAAWLLLFALSSPLHGKVRIVATLTDLASIAKEIGGEHVEITALSKGYQDPHFLQAKPSYMRLLNRADLLIYNGLELEVGWLPLLIRGARNPDISPGGQGHLNASQGIQALEVPSGDLDRSMGDIHPEGNPHYLLDPRNSLIVAASIADRLKALNFERSEIYDSNYESFKGKLESEMANWKLRFGDRKNLQVVTYHKHWPYFANWLEIDIVDQVEDKPGIPPSPKHVSALVNRMKTEDIQSLFAVNFSNQTIAQRVAERAGAKLLILPIHVEGESNISSYFELFEHLINQVSQISYPEGSK